MTLNKTAIFTIVSRNYMHYARCLMKSVAEAHPGAERFVLLADENDIGASLDGFNIVDIRDLNLPEEKKFLFRYTILELNTAVKPWMFEYLFYKKGFEKVIYLDPDIYVYNSLQGVFDLLNDGKMLVLTPHLTTPQDDDYKPNDREILLSGTYNLGFLAASRHKRIKDFLTWWQKKLEHFCVAEPERGIFVDQKWMDLVPGIFDSVQVLRDEGYNVAYWNLNKRNMVKDHSGYKVNGAPLVFFHFSGINPEDPSYITKHWGNSLTLNSIGDAKELVLHYCNRLREMHSGDYTHINYAYNYFENSSPIHDFMRIYYRNSKKVQNALGSNPFSTGFDYFNSPAHPEKQDKIVVTHCMKALYASRKDLQAYFMDIESEDRNDFACWFIKSARTEGLSAVYIRPVEDSLLHVQAFLPMKTRLKKKIRDFRFRIKQLLKQVYYNRLPISSQVQIKKIIDAMPDPLKGRIYQSVASGPRHDFQSNSLINTCKKTIGALAPFGINFIGYASAETGTGESVRSAARAAISADIRFTLKDLSYLCPGGTNDDSFPLCETDRHPFYFNIFHINADMAPLVYDQLGADFYKNRYNIGFWHWELNEFPDKWLSSFDLFDEIWAPSFFVIDTIARKSPVPVVRIPHAIQLPDWQWRGKKIFGLDEQKFYFLTMADVTSFLERKNPRAVIEAFKMAFSNNAQVGLVVKMHNTKGFEAEVESIKSYMKSVSNITLISHTMPRYDVIGLIAACDALVSLHRSEGFGLCPAEAMALGKPVIATNWSSNTDFMNHENSCPVRYRLVPIDHDIGPYEKGNYWADPDVNHASEYMTRLVADEQFRQTISSNARKTIENDFSSAYVGKLIRDRLRRIYQSKGNSNPDK